MTEDPKYRQKFKDLKKRIREIEEENDLLNIKLYKARKNIRHLKLERTLGFRYLLHDEPDMHLHKIQSSHKHHDGRGRIEKLMVAAINLSKEIRSKMNTQENLGEVTRLLGQKWKSLTKDEKKVI
ncbi:hypothetical protein BD560DRAFT_442510 [Blakeslea trispora]|nr:hypothetical protein BD560DRAFT_442510 [Blakeslea trispora]